MDWVSNGKVVGSTFRVSGVLGRLVFMFSFGAYYGLGEKLQCQFSESIGWCNTRSAIGKGR